MNKGQDSQLQTSIPQPSTASTYARRPHGQYSHRKPAHFPVSRVVIRVVIRVVVEEGDDHLHTRGLGLVQKVGVSVAVGVAVGMSVAVDVGISASVSLTD